MLSLLYLSRKSFFFLIFKSTWFYFLTKGSQVAKGTFKMYGLRKWIDYNILQKREKTSEALSMQTLYQHLLLSAYHLINDKDDGKIAILHYVGQSITKLAMIRNWNNQTWDTKQEKQKQRVTVSDRRHHACEFYTGWVDFLTAVTDSLRHCHGVFIRCSWALYLDDVSSSKRIEKWLHMHIFVFSLYDVGFSNWMITDGLNLKTYIGERGLKLMKSEAKRVGVDLDHVGKLDAMMVERVLTRRDRSLKRDG